MCGLDLHFPVIETMIKHCWLRSKAIKGEEEPLDVQRPSTVQSAGLPL